MTGFEQIIKDIKYQAELSQGEIASLLGCTQATISRIKSGKQTPKFETACRILELAKKYKIKVKMDNLTE